MAQLALTIGAALTQSAALAVATTDAAHPAQAADAPRTPTLAFRAPAALAGVARKLEAGAPAGLLPAMRLVGLADPGPAILVVLADERSPEARAAPPWVAGYASGAYRPVVLLPARSPSYPDGSLAAVLQHEVAHVLIARASGGGALPRWFDEGLAMAASRDTSLGDRSRAAFTVLRGGRRSLVAIDAAFADNDAGAVAAAYALARDLVRELLLRHGREAPAAILARVGRGEAFATAFAATTGVSLHQFEAAYWRDRTLWNRWLPLLTSSALLWGGITFLALAAFRRRRRRDAERYLRWELEDALRERARLDDDEPVN